MVLTLSINVASWSSVDQRWQGLRNALAGLFCASLGSLDEQRTTSPILTFKPEGVLPNWISPHQLRHASLPSEHVCTENLTPFLKLLPCKSQSGLASLLNPHQLFDADWHGMGVHVSLDPTNGVNVRLTFQSVSDPVRSSAGARRGPTFSVFDLMVVLTVCGPTQIGLLHRHSVAASKNIALSPRQAVSESSCQPTNHIRSPLNRQSLMTILPCSI
jgi:GPI-anchor transamidase subunit T